VANFHRHFITGVQNLKVFPLGVGKRTMNSSSMSSCSLQAAEGPEVFPSPVCFYFHYEMMNIRLWHLGESGGMFTYRFRHVNDYPIIFEIIFHA
jgi:hypothetical protein